MLKFSRKHFLFSSPPSSTILRSQPRIECMNGIHWAKKSITANQKAAQKTGSRWYIVLNEWTIMDRRAPPKSTGPAGSLR